MSLTSQKRLAASIRKVGVDKVWVDPDETEKVESAITRKEIRKLLHEGIMRIVPEEGTSRGRKRIAHRKKKLGRSKGQGSRKGPRSFRKNIWMMKIRTLRNELRTLRDKRLLQKGSYRKLIGLAKGGIFRNLAHLNDYLESNKLIRRR